MQIYLVGGAVRDHLLNHPIKDKDFVVVGATFDELLKQGFTQVGADFPVFLHPTTHHEYALARTERKSGHGYQGFIVDTTNVSLEDDLARRDLTINAMAMPVMSLFDDTLVGDVVDPYGGKIDLKNKVLRHVSPAFSENPLRVLRVARFYARLYDDGFIVHNDTAKLMQTIAQHGELSHLSRERIWTESVKALSERCGFAYFKLLFELDILKYILPELNDTLKDDTVYHHTLTALQKASDLPLHIKFALLTHGFIHQIDGTALLNKTCERLLTPKAIHQFANLFITHFNELHDLKNITPNQLLNLIENTKSQKDKKTLFELMQAVEILTDKIIDKSFINLAISHYHTIGIKDIDNTLKGRQIGDELTRLRVNKLTQLLKSNEIHQGNT